MKKLMIALITLAFTSTSSIAGPKIEVLHWWTSGGEAAALKVLKDDFAANGGEWMDMPVTGGGGDAANVALKARIVAGDPPSASQIKGPTIQEYDQEGVVAPYNIDAIAQSEGWDKLLDPMIAAVHNVKITVDHIVLHQLTFTELTGCGQTKLYLMLMVFQFQQLGMK